MPKLYIFLITMIFCIFTIQSTERSIIKLVNEQVNDLLFAEFPNCSGSDTLETKKNKILNYRIEFLVQYDHPENTAVKIS